MGRLGDVLEALYEAPRDVRSLHIRARHVVDEDAVVRVHEWWNRQREAIDGSRSTLLMARSQGDADADDNGIIREFWRADPDRWREDSGTVVTIHDSGERRTYLPAMGGYRLPGREQLGPPWFTLLHPRWLIDRCQIERRDTVVIAGRTCWALELRPAPDPLPNPRMNNPFAMPPWLGTEHSCCVDQETGIVLAIEARYEGEICSTWDSQVVEVNEAIDAAVLAFVPPDGKGWRSHVEFRAESMRRAGMDLTGVDVTDEAQLNEAMMRHHRDQFPGMFGSRPDPAELAEQHVATGAPPADVDAAETEVTRAFERIVTPSDDGESVPAVEGGSNLGPCLREAGARAPGGADLPASVTVEYVKFLHADEAVVWFTLLRGGQAVLGTMEGRGRRIADRWLVSRATFAQIVGSVGVRCPPPPEI